jgi:hypothetical protein
LGICLTVKRDIKIYILLLVISAIVIMIAILQARHQKPFYGRPAADNPVRTMQQ